MFPLGKDDPEYKKIHEHMNITICRENLFMMKKSLRKSYEKLWGCRKIFQRMCKFMYLLQAKDDITSPKKTT